MESASTSAPWARPVALVMLSFLMAGCTTPDDTPGTKTGTSPEQVGSEQSARISFTDITDPSGVDFVHDNGATGRLFYPEMMQGGVSVIDFDRDGNLDLYFVQSGPLPPDASGRAANRLYRGKGDGTFEDVTEGSGAGNTGYGSAAAVGDVNGDGWDDLYITNLGANQLLINGGDGTFSDAPDGATVAGNEYSTSATFFDADNDGDLDLFVANYVDWSPQTEKRCFGPQGVRGYCNPAEYSPQPDRLYLNRGDGSFEDHSRASGIAQLAANGLGVVAADFDGDGRTDLYVANDQMANHLWMQQSDGTFQEQALLRGAALSEQGLPEAGMGIALADPDQDGDLDLFLTHLSNETNTFYRNLGSATFSDATDAARLGVVSQPYTGFGTGFFDFDHDGMLDLFIANGKVSQTDAADPLQASSFAEPNQLLAGTRDGRFVPVPGVPGGDSASARVSRAAAFGDLDNDGDIDIVVSNNAGPAQLLRNDSQKHGHWLTVELDDAAIGRTVEVDLEMPSDASGQTRSAVFQPTTGYCSTNTKRVHFGLPAEGTVLEVRVTLDGGVIRERNPPIDQPLVLGRSSQ